MKKRRALRLLEGVRPDTTKEELGLLLHTCREHEKNLELSLVLRDPGQMELLKSHSVPANVKVFISDELVGAEQSSAPFEPKFADVLQYVFRDPSLPLLYDRKVFTRWRSAQRNISIGKYNDHIAKLAYQAFVMFGRVQPDYLGCFASTPHNTEGLVMVLVAEALAIDVLVVQRTMVPGYARVTKGFRRNSAPIPVLHGDSTKFQIEYKTDSESYRDNVLSTYNVAMPAYERDRMKSHGGRFISFKNLFRQNWNRPSWISNAYRCWNTLCDLSVKLPSDSASPTVVVFLHYQPERTSLPEGDGFTQSLSQILALRASLPDSVRILVKEHPSTFRNNCVPSVRDPDFYKNIAGLPGVQFVNIESDTFDLIDKAACVVTTTGTVGIESLIRGVPTVFFGISPGGSIQGKHVYQDGAQLGTFLGDVLNGSFAKNDIMASAWNALEHERKFAFQIDSAAAGSRVKYSALAAILPALLST